MFGHSVLSSSIIMTGLSDEMCILIFTPYCAGIKTINSLSSEYTLIDYMSNMKYNLLIKYLLHEKYIIRKFIL